MGGGETDYREGDGSLCLKNLSSEGRRYYVVLGKAEESKKRVGKSLRMCVGNKWVCKGETGNLTFGGKL